MKREKRLVLVLGGARAGKSAFAANLAAHLGERVLVLATARPEDPEMAERIARHRASRPPHWRTVEEPLHVAGALRWTARGTEVVLLDCLTVWLSNWLWAHRALSPEAQEASVQAEVSALLSAYREGTASLVCVSNEVGMGLVPENPLGRRFRDLLGWANRRLAGEADQVFLMVAGIPLDLKAPGGLTPSG